MNWRFFGEWAAKHTKRAGFVSYEDFDRLCDKDKALLLKSEKESNATIWSIMFWLFCFAAIFGIVMWVI